MRDLSKWIGEPKQAIKALALCQHLLDKPHLSSLPINAKAKLVVCLIQINGSLDSATIGNALSLSTGFAVIQKVAFTFYKTGSRCRSNQGRVALLRNTSLVGPPWRRVTICPADSVLAELKSW